MCPPHRPQAHKGSFGPEVHLPVTFTGCAPVSNPVRVKRTRSSDRPDIGSWRNRVSWHQFRLGAARLANPSEDGGRRVGYTDFSPGVVLESLWRRGPLVLTSPMLLKMV